MVAFNGSFFGTARLAEALTRSLGRPAVSIVKTIEDDLSAFSRGAQRQDDMAVVVVRVAGVPD